MSTLTDIKNTIDASLSKSTWWQRFIGSQFVAYFALIMAQIVQRCEQAAAKALQNSFLPTATTRAAILASAESRGYVGRKAQPSVGTARITNNTNARISASSLMQVTAANQVPYTVLDHIDLARGESVILPLSQVEIESLSYVVEAEQSWLTVLIPAEYTERLHKMVVRVDGEEWASSFMFRNAIEDSEVYMESYKSTDQYTLRFGNGINGKRPAAGSKIEVDLWLTLGETTLLDGQKLTIKETQSLPFKTSDLTIVTETQIIGGEEPEDIESIRAGAMYSSIYDNQVAWDGDYNGLIRANISKLVWVSSWGEKQQEKLMGKKDAKNINRIFISAYSSTKSDDVLGEEILALFAGKEGYNETYHIAQRQDAPITVHVTGKVRDSYNTSDGQKAIIDALEALYGKDIKKKSGVYLKDIWSAVNSVADSNGVYDFSVTATGILDQVPVDTYQYIDAANSVVELDYAEV